MTSIEDTVAFETILDEANAHYSTGRFVDAAKTFEHLSSMCIKSKKFDDMLYFIYRALIAWSNEKSVYNKLRLYQRVGIFSLKFSTKLAMEELEQSISISKKLDLLIIIQKNLVYLDEKEKRIEILTQMIPIITDMIAIEGEYIKRKALIEHSIEIHEELNNNQEIEEMIFKKGILIEEEADYQLVNADFDADEVAERLYVEAMAYFMRLNKKKEMNRVSSKLKKLKN